MASRILTAERLRELLSYDPESDTWTRIKYEGHWQSRAPCVVTGTIGPRGYRCMRIDYRLYPLHRLVWLWHNGVLPDKYIDHRYGDKLNNRISKLRNVPPAWNSQNELGLRKTNTSGATGVEVRGSRFRVKITVDFKSINIGTFGSIDEATAAYVEAKRRLHPGCTI